MMHDFALTSGHVIFMELPVVFDIQRALNASIPFTWSDTYGARLGILPRGAAIEELRWVEVEPCYVYHVANAFETADGTITVEVARYQSAWRPDGKRSARASLDGAFRRGQAKPRKRNSTIRRSSSRASTIATPEGLI
jgi:carotenoid cleavage dioxygenase-like enzyme